MVNSPSVGCVLKTGVLSDTPKFSWPYSPRVSSPTPWFQDSASGDTIRGKATDTIGNWDVVMTWRQRESWVLLTCWERPQGANPLLQPGHWSWVDSTAFMVGWRGQRRKGGGKRFIYEKNEVSHCNTNIKGDIPLIQILIPIPVFSCYTQILPTLFPSRLLPCFIHRKYRSSNIWYRHRHSAGREDNVSMASNHPQSKSTCYAIRHFWHTRKHVRNAP